MHRRKTETTIRAYNRQAAKFADKFGNYRPYRDKIEEFQRRFLPARAAILDVGCGPGINAKILLSKNSRYDITGLDLSPEMITLARRNVPGARFMVADMRFLELTERYDAIIAAFCIVHLSDTETTELLQTLSGSLKAGGCLYLSFMEGKPAGFETTSFSPDRLYFNYHARDVIGAVLLKHSIKTVALYAADYLEEDGSFTKDVFIFGQKKP